MQWTTRSGALTMQCTSPAQAGPSSRPSTTWLAYAESGVALLGSDPFEARRSLLYQHGCAGPVRCYFDDSPEARTVEARIEAARFFHEISLEGSEPFLHPCGPDVYSGRLIFESVDAFRFDWRVTGPRKQGWVTNRFRREPGPD